MTYHQNNGLLIDPATNPPTCCGYIFNFTGHGAFAPCGRVQLQNGVVRDLVQDEINEHNRLLGEIEWTALKKHGRGVLYLTRDKDDHYKVATWVDSNHVFPWRVSKSWHNFAGHNGRTDVWFNLDGSSWHGVNIGDNQICRVKRCKE